MKQPLKEVMERATPGPFTSNGRNIFCPTHRVAECEGCSWNNGIEDKANAALLAHFRNAGPELVEALDKLTTDIELAYLNEKWSEVLFAKDRVLDLLARAKEVEVP